MMEDRGNRVDPGPTEAADARQAAKGTDQTSGDKKDGPGLRQSLEREWRVLLLITLLVVVAGILLWQAFVQKGQPDVEVVCTGELPEVDRLEPPQYFIEDQIIVTGPAEDAGRVVGELRGVLDPTPLYSCTVIQRQGEVKMGLYRLAGSTTIAQALRAVQESRGDAPVFADPNYLIGLLGQSSCGSPHGIGPSPHGIGPSPHGIGPSPIGPSQPGPPHAGAAQLFREQWAFDHIGLSPWPTGSIPIADLPTGSGVLVGVFDTSPYPAPQPGKPGSPGASLPMTITLTESHGVSPDWTFGAWYPDLQPLEPSGDVLAVDLSEHGLFVSSLIHALAPESDIRLVRVLNEYGCGTLINLNEALFRFIAEVASERSSLDGAVINLSLGLQRPSTDTEVEPVRQETPTPQPTPELGTAEEQPDTKGTHTRALELLEVEERASMAAQTPGSGATTAFIYIDDELTVIAEDTVDSLQAAIELAHERGVVVVAAAGNDSGVDRLPRPPQLPAAYPSVIGVAGTNISRERSCFSNWGDVSAPAGEGGENSNLLAELQQDYPGVYADTDCLPVTDRCIDECQTGLIGLVSEGPSHYAFWSGTSFAAPLVSGLAAQAADTGASPGPSQPTWLPPDDVFAAIRCGAPTHDGDVEVPASLGRCTP